MTIVVEREMGFERADFLRVLPKGLRCEFVVVEGDTVHAQASGGRRLTVRLQEKPRRRIALLSLPVLGVRFEFDGYNEDEARDLLATFDKHVHRGGG